MNTYYENLKDFTKMSLEITIEFSKITEPKVDCDLAKLLVNRNSTFSKQKKSIIFVYYQLIIETKIQSTSISIS